MRIVSALVNVSWLAERLSSPALSPLPLRVLDGSYYLPKHNRDQRAEYRQKHIPGALFFDIQECSDKSSPYRNMLPPIEQFESYVGDLGVDNNTHVVVYDGMDRGLFSAARVWWMFRVFGHPTVSVLNGGLVKWCELGHPVTDEIPQVEKAKFSTTYNPSLVRDFDFVEKNLTQQSIQMVDSRSANVFNGEADPSSKPDVGHMPGAINVPLGRIVDYETKIVKSPEKLQEMFSASGVDLARPLVATCGSGVTACGVALAAHLCGKEDVPVYDGSWSEWSKRAPPENIVCGTHEKQG
ncbi:3-mercaptopyruvate sulfurtransferase-like isoform X1 [Branchiostoma floridae x Branchiostoma japonicum]